MGLFSNGVENDKYYSPPKQTGNVLLGLLKKVHCNKILCPYEDVEVHLKKSQLQINQYYLLLFFCSGDIWCCGPFFPLFFFFTRFFFLSNETLSSLQVLLHVLQVELFFIT